MKNIFISEDIIPVGEFKAKLAMYLQLIREKQKSVIITQNGKPAGVLISPADFDELIQTRQFIDSILRGVSDAERGEVYSTASLRKELKRRKTVKAG